MWAHYTDRAKGAIVIFEELELLFVGDATGVLNAPRSVRYSEERPGINFDPDSHENLFFSKVSDWSYEREVRIVSPLDECEETLEGIHVKQISQEHVVVAILGWRMNTSEKEFIKEAFKHKIIYDARYDGRRIVITEA
jgi:Protein of unknown function (DUF2971)